jgi:hypothetical protein
LIDDGLNNEIGKTSVIVKQPSFSYDRNYKTDMSEVVFDFIMAQSIFSHTGESTTREALNSFKGSLATNGIVVANWLIGNETGQFDPATCDWVYPECVPFSLKRVSRLASEAGLVARICP